MARATPSRNLFGLGKRKPARRKATAKKRGRLAWLTEKKVTYKRDVRGERAKLMREAKAEKAERARAERERLRTESMELKRQEVEERKRKLERKRADAVDRKIEQEWREKGYRNPGECARTLKPEVTDRAKRTPKSKRREFASEIWSRRESHGTARGFGQSGDAPDWVTNPSWYRTLGEEAGFEDGYDGSAKRTSEQLKAQLSDPSITPKQWATFLKSYQTGFTRGRGRSKATANPKETAESSTEYRLGYNLGQMDRQNTALRRTDDELTSVCKAQFPNWHSVGIFISGYDDGYGFPAPAGRTNPCATPGRGNSGFRKRSNPEPDVEDDGSEEYQLAKRTAELFHGRPVKEVITVDESIRTHDWYVSIGPLVKLKVKTVTKQNATFPFPMKGEGLVHLFCSPEGRQFYLRGGDQEIDLKPLGMDGGRWFRDKMILGEIREITYLDRKAFHKFAPVQYYHKLGEETNVKPWLVYDTMNKHLEIVGGQYHVETEELVDDMSPGVVN